MTLSPMTTGSDFRCSFSTLDKPDAIYTGVQIQTSVDFRRLVCERAGGGSNDIAGAAFRA